MTQRLLSYKLPLIITKQGKRFVAYTSALDISTSGTTEKRVKKNFEELVSLFIEELIKAGTADEVLASLGWKKVQKQWQPPKVISSSYVGVRAPAFA